MSAILKFDFQKRKQLRFSEVNYLNYAKKDPILHVATRGNKNKPWTHSTPLKDYDFIINTSELIEKAFKNSGHIFFFL